MKTYTALPNLWNALLDAVSLSSFDLGCYKTDCFFSFLRHALLDTVNFPSFDLGSWKTDCYFYFLRLILPDRLFIFLSTICTSRETLFSFLRLVRPDRLLHFIPTISTSRQTVYFPSYDLYFQTDCFILFLRFLLPDKLFIFLPTRCNPSKPIASLSPHDLCSFKTVELIHFTN